VREEVEIIMIVYLKYFSGTGNSYKILDTCKDFFVKSGCKVELSSITDELNIHEETKLIGFCFPVYAFGIPRICRNYLLNLPKIRNFHSILAIGNSSTTG